MELQSDFTGNRQQVLCIDSRNHHFLDLLKKHLKKYDNDVYISPRLPANISKFNLFFIVNNPDLIDTFTNHPYEKLIFLFTNKKKEAERLSEFVLKYHKPNIKVINLEDPHDITQADIDSIVWFVFSRSDEHFLNIKNEKIKTHAPSAPIKTRPKLNLTYFIKPRRTITYGLLAILVFHLLFFVPLLFASFLHYRAVKSISTKDFATTNFYLEQSGDFLSTAKNLYAPVRPTFLLFALVVYPDNLIEINERSHHALQTSLQLAKQGSLISSLIFKKDKTPEEKQQMVTAFGGVGEEAGTLEDDLASIYQKFPTFTLHLRQEKEKLKTNLNLLTTYKKFLPFIGDIMAQNAEKKYLLLFANNMELRPGGGFIGSYAIVRVKDLSIQELKVYDVYDADGQLKIHIPPPKPIEKYLSQPHWFLRDSAFSGDFFENYTQALGFLQKEMGETGFDGGVLITTSAIQNILAAAGNLYIPDFKEIVNKDNFYLKAQIYAEKEFFPGSQQKKRFLSAVLDQLLISTDSISPAVFLEMLQKSLNEKQIVAYSNNTSVQNLIDSQYWSGRTILPNCTTAQPNCVTDYLYPLEANLGVNKANFFVSRSISLAVTLSPDGTISNHLTVQLKNDSLYDVFPGGSYKNYFQVLLPINASVKTITRNGSLIEDFDETNTSYHTIGFFTEIKPQTSATIDIQYQLGTQLKTGNGIYQLVVQKQIGTGNSDFNLQISLPKNMYIVNQNFSPLVKEHTIVYNTNLSSDKIFFIDLIKE